MSWLFGNTYVQQSINTVEIKSIAGVAAGLLALAVAYGALRLHGKFIKAKIERTTRKEVRLKNSVVQFVHEADECA